MNREQRLEMLERLAEMPSIELKMNVPADQRMALSGLHLDLMAAKLREVYFFDTPDLTLFANGVVTRARRTQGDDDDTVVKLRPAEPKSLPPEVRDSKNLKCEMDVTRGAYVVSASLKEAAAPARSARRSPVAARWRSCSPRSSGPSSPTTRRPGSAGRTWCRWGRCWWSCSSGCPRG